MKQEQRDEAELQAEMEKRRQLEALIKEKKITKAQALKNGMIDPSLASNESDVEDLAGNDGIITADEVPVIRFVFGFLDFVAFLFSVKARDQETNITLRGNDLKRVICFLKLFRLDRHLITKKISVLFLKHFFPSFKTLQYKQRRFGKTAHATK